MADKDTNTKDTDAKIGTPVQYIAIAPGFLNGTYVEAGEGFTWDGPKGDWMQEYDPAANLGVPAFTSEQQGNFQTAVVKAPGMVGVAAIDFDPLGATDARSMPNVNGAKFEAGIPAEAQDTANASKGAKAK